MDLQYSQPRNIMFLSRRHRITKRIFDLTLCIIALPMLLALMAACALLIWLDDPGPILAKQQRTGKGGQRFDMYKFRTRFANDRRATSAGQLLRKVSLDELPQILNVLKGEMSLVGPRPASFDGGTYSQWHAKRLGVLPGITGLWQIRGRSEGSLDERLRLDIEYIERQSVSLDIQILLRTFALTLDQNETN